MNKTGNSSSVEEKKSADSPAPAAAADAGGNPSSHSESPELNRTMVMPSNRAIPLNQSGKAAQKPRKNLSARFSLEVIRDKNSEKEIVNDYFGRNLTRYTSMPIDSSPEISADLMPELGNRYENLEVFNEGGQGIISAAKENALGRIVALKTLRPAKNGQNSGDSDFISEAKVTAQLDHPSIIPIYAIGKNPDGQLQLAMKLVNGKTLRDHLKNIVLNYRLRGIKAFDERSSLYKRLEIFLHVCDALVYAHHRRIMHCDLKPENIMIGEYMEVYLMDWGLAKPIPDPDDKSEWVRPETIAGTPRYLSPEAIVGERFDQRSDIFAMGLILQEVVTLKYAVSGEDSSEVMNKIKDGQLDPPVHQYGFPVDRDMIAIIRKATAYHKEDRYQSIQALGNDVRFYMQGNEVSANPDNFVMKTVRWMTRHRMTMLLVIFITLALALGTVAVSIYHNLEQTRQMSERSEMISRAYGKCFAATSQFDREILSQEKNIMLLAGLAARALSSWTTHEEEPKFRLYDKNGKLSAPPDAVFSPGYDGTVSFTAGMCKPADPKLTQEEIMLKIQQLSPLLSTMREIILDSGAELAVLKDDEQSRLRIAIQEGPTVKSLYIGLENGLQFGFPWRDIYQKSFDPRKRPWYRRGQTASKPVWGAPYVGSDFHLGPCLPCSVRIQDERGNFYGVAGMDLTFNKLAFLLHRSGNTGHFVLDSALINANGQIVASTDFRSKKGEKQQNQDLSAKLEKNAELEMVYFSIPKIRRAILEQKFGIISDHEPGRGEVIYLFAQLKTLNWIFVQKIDLEVYRTYYRRNQLLQKTYPMQQF